MTSNRKTKQAVRATQRRTGMKYTTARRALASTDSDAPSTGESRLALGNTAEGTPVLLPGPDMPPLIWMSGITGGGKTVAANHLAHQFLAHHPDARVLWFSPAYSRNPYWVTSDAHRIHLGTPPGPGSLDLASAVDTLNRALDETDGTRLFLVIDEAAFVLNAAPIEAHELLSRLATQGRSRNVRVLLTSQTRPDPDMLGARVWNAIGARVLIGRTSREHWERFFGRPSETTEFDDLPERGYGWVADIFSEPTQFRFPAAPAIAESA